MELPSPNSGSHAFLPYLLFSGPSLTSSLDLLPSPLLFLFLLPKASFYTYPPTYILLHMSSTTYRFFLLFYMHNSVGDDLWNCHAVHNAHIIPQDYYTLH